MWSPLRRRTLLRVSGLGLAVLAGCSADGERDEQQTDETSSPSSAPHSDDYSHGQRPTETTTAEETTERTETSTQEDEDEDKDADVTNPIVEENRKRGDEGWQSQSIPENSRTIEGYTTRDSVAPGETLEFHVSTDPAERYRVDIYRLGWYGGVGGRRVWSLPTNRGTSRPIPEPEGPRQLVECDWPVTDTIKIPKGWVSGLHIARFVLQSGQRAGESSAYPFVVREPTGNREANAVVQLPIATQQAYDGWGGKGLYEFVSEGSRAYAVSDNRPYEQPFNTHLGYSIHLLRWLEKEGYHVSYVSDHDVHCEPALLREYDLAIVSGHDEYWSLQQKRGFEVARDDGTNLAILASNTCFWQVRYEDDGQTMVCYKTAMKQDPVQGTRRTGMFREVGEPEATLLGVQGTGGGEWQFPDLAVAKEALDHPWFEGTGFEADDRVIGCVGHEWDSVVKASPKNVKKFFHYERGTSRWSDDIDPNSDADTTVYERNDACVFATGTMGWAWRVDPDSTWDWDNWPFNRMREEKPELETPDSRLQRFSKNVLDDLIE